MKYKESAHMACLKNPITQLSLETSAIRILLNWSSIFIPQTMIAYAVIVEHVKFPFSFASMFVDFVC
jgi:hypothetical protein